MLDEPIRIIFAIFEFDFCKMLIFARTILLKLESLSRILIEFSDVISGSSGDGLAQTRAAWVSASSCLFFGTLLASAIH